MKRKFLAGAFALALPMSGVAMIGVAPAGAATTITSVVIKDAGNNTVTSIMPYQDYTITISGSKLPTVGLTGDKIITASIAGNGLYGLLGSPLTVNSIVSTDASKVKFTATGPTGNNLIYINGGAHPGYQPGTLTLNVQKKAAGKKPASNFASWTSGSQGVVSNCGDTLPAAATAGNTYLPYASGDHQGQLDLSTTTGTGNISYFDVIINVIIKNANLCADDIGTPTSVGLPAYNTNYPVTFTSGGSIPTYSMKNVSFSFPYTANNTLSVYGEQEKFQLSGSGSDFTGAVCGGLGATQPTGVTIQSCTVDATGLVTLQATGTTTYHTGDTIQAPTFSILGLGSAGVTLTPVSTTSEIGLFTPSGGAPHTAGSCTFNSGTGVWTPVPGVGGSQVCTGIIFAPRAATSNATWTVATSS